MLLQSVSGVTLSSAVCILAVRWSWSVGKVLKTVKSSESVAFAFGRLERNY
jgi:hypothetical protein